MPGRLQWLEMRVVLARWFVFTVLVGLLPFLFRFLPGLIGGIAVEPAQFLARGELLLFAAALSAAGIGEVVGVGADYPFAKIVAGGACLLTLVIASYSFAHIAGSDEGALQLAAIRDLSLSLYIFSIISGASCIILRGERV